MMRYVESLNQGLHKLMEQDNRVFVMGEDILDPYGGAFKVTKGLSSKYPARVLTTPISEGAITGFASGMSMRGFRPIVEIMFGDFLTLCCDQIVNSACKFRWMYNEQVEVPVVIRTPMGARRGYGPTHSQTLETLFLGVPGLTIVAPSHFHNPGELLQNACQKTQNPVLFIENKLLYPMQLFNFSGEHAGNVNVRWISNSSENFQTMALSFASNQKPDIVLITYGGMAPLAYEAVLNVFMRDEIVVELLIPALVKPVPIADILPSVYQCGKLIVAEEGVKTNGWGSEIASLVQEELVTRLEKPILRLGAPLLPIPSSKPLEDQLLPQVADIEAAIYKQLEV